VRAGRARRWADSSLIWALSLREGGAADAPAGPRKKLAVAAAAMNNAVFVIAITLSYRRRLVNGPALALARLSPTTRAMTGPLADPLAWHGIAAPSLAEIELLAEQAFRRLPAHFRAKCEGLVFHVEDLATDEVLDSMGMQNELDLMGLFHGVGLPFQSDSAPVQMPNMIWLYRVPILLYWAEHEETLGSVITHVLVHEIGHHFGLSDADMEAIEASAE
jgi:predicted Zn-dependent protease with MMP-like domain